MEYSKEQIESAKADASPNALAYIEELETRLSLVNGTVNDFLQNMGFPPMAEINNDAVLLQIDLAKVQANQIVTNAANELDGENKCGECVQLRIDSYDEPGNKVLWESMGYFITLSTETPEEARALYTALLTVKEVETD